MAFGEQLQLLRRRSGLTQEQFAEELRVSRQAVSKLESGKGYQWKKSAIYKTKQARPFHQKAQELAIGTGLVRDALAKSLTESGFKVKE